MGESEIELLKKALLVYRKKWDNDIEKLQEEPLEGDSRFNRISRRIQLNSLSYLSSWIINSIDGGINNHHATNICNILDESK